MTNSPVAGAPHLVQVDVGGRISVFRLLEDHYAVHGTDPSATESAAVLLLIDDVKDAPVAVFRGDVKRHLIESTGNRASPNPRIGPVYAVEPGGSIAVPTGRVLVRFREGMMAADHGDELQHASFTVDEILRYAPQAAWVRPPDGSIATALRRLDTLAKLPGVEHVEPQMLMARGPR